MKEKTKQINKWKELVDLIENINPYKQTIILSGWLNKIDKDKLKIDKLYFKIVDNELLKEKQPKISDEEIDDDIF